MSEEKCGRGPADCPMEARITNLERLTDSVSGLAKSISDIQAEPGNTYKDLKGKAAWAVIGGVLVALVTAGLKLVGL